MFPGPKRDPGNDRGTDRNRRVSSPLSPICSLFLAPSGTLSLQVQRLLAHDETPDASPPAMGGKRRPGPKRPASGLPPSPFPLADGPSSGGGEQRTTSSGCTGVWGLA